MPDTTCPCAGAAQKILYMACDLWRSRGVLDDMRVVLTAPEDTIFGVPVGGDVLQRAIDDCGIELRTRTVVPSVDAGSTTIESDGATEEISCDFLHPTPPHIAPDWVVDCGLSAEGARVRWTWIPVGCAIASTRTSGHSGTSQSPRAPVPVVRCGSRHQVFDSRKERRPTFLFDRWGLPWIYWHRILRGK